MWQCSWLEATNADLLFQKEGVYGKDPGGFKSRQTAGTQGCKERQGLNEPGLGAGEDGSAYQLCCSYQCNFRSPPSP